VINEKYQMQKKMIKMRFEFFVQSVTRTALSCIFVIWIEYDRNELENSTRLLKED